MSKSKVTTPSKPLKSKTKTTVAITAAVATASALGFTVYAYATSMHLEDTACVQINSGNNQTGNNRVVCNVPDPVVGEHTEYKYEVLSTGAVSGLQMRSSNTPDGHQLNRGDKKLAVYQGEKVSVMCTARGWRPTGVPDNLPNGDTWALLEQPYKSWVNAGWLRPVATSAPDCSSEQKNQVFHDMSKS